MNKTFTLGEAQMLVPVLEALLKRAQGYGSRAAEKALAMQQLSQRIFLAGGMHVDVRSAARTRAERDKAAQELKDTLAELESIGVRVHDLREGKLDFPFVLDGETVLLCWKSGDREIQYWHGTDPSDDERRLLDERFGKTDRPN